MKIHLNSIVGECNLVLFSFHGCSFAVDIFFSSLCVLNGSSFCHRSHLNKNLCGVKYVLEPLFDTLLRLAADYGRNENSISTNMETTQKVRWKYRCFQGWCRDRISTRFICSWMKVLTKCSLPIIYLISYTIFVGHRLKTHPFVKRKDDALTYFLLSLFLTRSKECVNTSESGAHCKPSRLSGTTSRDSMRLHQYQGLVCSFRVSIPRLLSRSIFEWLSRSPVLSSRHGVHNECGNVYQLRASSSSHILRPCPFCIICFRVPTS